MKQITIIDVPNVKKTDDNKENMRQHIKEKHKLSIVTKCNLCKYEDKSFTGLKKHFRSKHVKNILS